MTARLGRFFVITSALVGAGIGYAVWHPSGVAPRGSQKSGEDVLTATALQGSREGGSRIERKQQRPPIVVEAIAPPTRNGGRDPLSTRTVESTELSGSVAPSQEPIVQDEEAVTFAWEQSLEGAPSNPALIEAVKARLGEIQENAERRFVARTIECRAQTCRITVSFADATGSVVLPQLVSHQLGKTFDITYYRTSDDGGGVFYAAKGDGPPELGTL